MVDKPILFSAAMVRALMDGRKSMTRRILKPQPPAECSIHYMLGRESWLPDNQQTPLRHEWEAWSGPLFHAKPEKAMCGSFTVPMRFAPGDRLWVKETAWICPPFWTDSPQNPMGPDRREVAYKADDRSGYTANAAADYKLKLTPSIFMPRWASRLTLTVTDVRVQRLQEISEEDAIAEGIEFRDGCWGIWEPDGTMKCGGSPDPVEAYRCLWLNINGAGSWEANPWIVAVSFSVERRNIHA